MRTTEPDAASCVLSLRDLGRPQTAIVGAKAASLGELSRIDGILVPDGFCVTADAFRRAVAELPSVEKQLDQLSELRAGDRASVAMISEQIRREVESSPVPDVLAAAVTRAVTTLEGPAFAVRSSATAEDLPSASFAGQQDTYLNVVGTASVLQHIVRCWASLFTERAVLYRLRNRFDHRDVGMAVLVQRMVIPEASGVVFTADPVTSNRKVVTVEACFGLGEAVVSGLVNPDIWKVRDGEIISSSAGAKLLAVRPAPAGGTRQEPIEAAHQRQPVLTNAQVVRLADLSRRIEAHFGGPQDIEWCLAGDDFEIVQSRPITTLFPIPIPGTRDGENHVYLSVGHQQMMTDAMKPLGLSLFQLTAMRPMYEAGGRLFVDVTRELASPSGQGRLLEMVGRSDPLIGDALQTILDRGDFITPVPDDLAPGGPPPGAAAPPLETDPSIVTELVQQSEASIAALKQGIAEMSGEALVDFILADIQELKRRLSDPLSFRAIMAGMEATWWLNDQLHAWLGEKNAADALSQSVANNVTSEMGLALLDVADAIRPHPAVIAFLEQVDDDGFVDRLPDIEGGQEAHAAIVGYLELYGMRCVGEIDITRPRWAERPTTLVPVILGNIKSFEAGARQRRFEQGRREASRMQREVLDRLRALPDGARKADDAKRAIDRLRTFVGYREHPKYAMISRYFVYKQALLEEAGRLVHAHVLGEADDVYYLTLPELRDVVRTHQVDDELIRRRKAEHASFQALTPPRVLTSDGEVVAGTYRRDDLPPGSLPGLAVSAGTVEGRARVILDMADADLGPDDILVTAYTDPSWSPLFVTIKGLVTEVGGLMTHGAVIAREYGLPAVVGVEHATELIEDGQRIRVDGTHGYIELLSPTAPGHATS